jgi:hypothetical protein
MLTTGFIVGTNLNKKELIPFDTFILTIGFVVGTNLNKKRIDFIL